MLSSFYSEGVRFFCLFFFLNYFSFNWNTEDVLYCQNFLLIRRICGFFCHGEYKREFIRKIISKLQTTISEAKNPWLMIKPDIVTVIRSCALIVTSALIVILRYTNNYELVRKCQNIPPEMLLCFHSFHIQK